MAARQIRIGQHPDYRDEVRGTLAEILAFPANPGTYAAPEDVTGTFLEMGTDGMWSGASVGTLTKAQADAIKAEQGVRATLKVGVPAQVDGGPVTWRGASAGGWVAESRTSVDSTSYSGDAWLGDSIYAGTGGRVWSGGNIIPTNAADPDWVHALGLSLPNVIAMASGQKLRAGLNFGVGGDNSAGIYARVPEVIARRPRRCFVGCGTNDLGGSTASVVEFTRLIAVALIQAGIEPILTPLPPKNATAAIMKQIQAINYGKQQIATKLGVKFLSTLWDGMIASDGAWANGNTYSSDYTHPNASGMFKAYDNCKNYFSQYDSIDLPHFNDGNGIYTNQVMDGAGGVPTGWIAGTATGLTRSLVSRADGCGNDFVLTCAGVTAALTASTTINVTAGHLISVEFDFNVSGADAGFYSDVRFVSGSVTGKMLDPITAFNYSGVCRRELRIPVGATTIQLLVVYGYQSNTGVGSANGTVKIGRLRIKDLTADGFDPMY